MGAAIALRAKSEFDITVFDKDNQKLSQAIGVKVASDLKDLLNKSEVVILAIKPQDFVVALTEIKDNVKDKLIISIAAGKRTKDIEDILGAVRVIRVMPNIAAIVGKSVSYICRGTFATESDWNLAAKVFDLIGHTFIISEDLMHAATAVGGSGPGFWGYLADKVTENERAKYESESFIPELTNAAVKIGLDKEMASLSAEFVVRGSSVTASALKITPLELAGRVASKRGTTEAGLEILKNGGTLTEAVEAAARRSEELSKE